MEYYEEKNIVKVKGFGNFNIKDTLMSGQCFRWEEKEDGFAGVAKGKYLFLKQSKDEKTFYCTPDDFRSVWRTYFDLDRDYDAIREELTEAEPLLRQACGFAPGIRILRQEPWEALCSFIISQNSNIPKIKRSVKILCENFGDELPNGEHSFPKPERLAQLTEDELNPLRCGYRARYIIDAAKKTANGEINFEEIKSLPIEEARAALCTITGVGKKVADCALLYGFERLDCFPVDRWIQLALDKYFKNGTPITSHRFAGIAQLYLFYMMISTGGTESEKN